MTSILFLLTYQYLYYLGFGLFNFLLSLKKKNLYREYYLSNDVSVKIFFPIVSLFFIGNSVFISNFFFPIKEISNILFFIYSIFFLYGCYFQYISKSNSQNILTDFLIPIILGVSSYGSRLHYDAGAYHLNHQNWIFNEKIAYGLSNLNTFYSYGSIQEYMSVIFWPFENYIFLHFINLIFFVVLFKFLYNNLIIREFSFLKSASVVLVGYSFFDNFGVGGGGNGFFQIQTIGKPDVSVGILFLITFLLVTNNFINKSFSFGDFNFILFLSLFSFQLKIIGGGLIFLLVPFAIKIISEKIIRLRKHIYDLLFFFTLFILWITKYFIISGCLVFPVSFTCFKNTKWINYQEILNSTRRTVEGNFAYSFDQNYLNWLSNWSNNQYNFQIFSNFLISFIIIFIIKILLFKSKILSISLNFWLFVFISINIFLFFTTVPVVRNGFGIWSSLICLIVLNTQKFRFKIYEKITSRLIVNASLILIAFLTPRMYMYEEFIEQYATFYKVESENVVYVLNEDQVSFLPKEGNQCWISKYCLLGSNKIVEVKDSSFYRMFLPNK